jgi:hypothetical protein
MLLLLVLLPRSLTLLLPGLRVSAALLLLLLAGAVLLCCLLEEMTEPRGFRTAAVVPTTSKATKHPAEEAGVQTHPPAAAAPPQMHQHKQKSTW